MPYKRANTVEEEKPDTKVPVTEVPRKGDHASVRLSVIVSRLNLGEYDSNYHYGALAYLENIKHYILLYRVANQPWSVDNFILLKKKYDPSLDMIDGNKKIQELMNKCQGLVPIGYKKRKTRKIRRKNKTRKIL